MGFLEFLWELAEVLCFIPGVVVEYSNKFQGVHGEGVCVDILTVLLYM